jgi:integrase
MTKRNAKTRTHRPLGGGLIQVKGRPGLFGQIRVGDKRKQKLLVLDEADRDGAEAALAEWVLEEVGPTADRDELREFADWLLDVAKTSPLAARFDALAKKALGVVEERPATPDGLRNVTTTTFLPEFLKTMEGRVSDEHFDDVKSRCKRFADFAGDRPMSSIDASLVADYLAKLAASDGHPYKVAVRGKDWKPKLDDEGKPVEKVVRDRLSPHAMRRHRSALSLLWKCAIDRRAVAANVWTGNAAKIARGQEFVPINLTDAEVERILAHVAAPVRPILTFCAETGVRLGEARALTWQRVDPGFGKFTVARAKSGKSRKLPTTAKARKLLEERWNGHVAKTHGEDLVFEDYSRSRIFVLFKDAVKAAGVDRRARVHDLRHHVGSALANANVPIHVVMQALGHSRLQTVQRYVHGTADALDEAFRAIEATRAAPPAAKTRKKARTA